MRCILVRGTYTRTLHDGSLQLEDVVVVEPRSLLRFCDLFTPLHHPHLCVLRTRDAVGTLVLAQQPNQLLAPSPQAVDQVFTPTRLPLRAVANEKRRTRGHQMICVLGEEARWRSDPRVSERASCSHEIATQCNRLFLPGPKIKNRGARGAGAVKSTRRVRVSIERLCVEAGGRCG